MRTIGSVLLVEDNPGDARLLREMFNEPTSQATRLSHVTCMGDARKYLADNDVDIVLLDLGLPDVQGLEGIRQVHAVAPRLPLVVLTGNDDDLIAVQALHEGAQDFLIKGQIDSRGLLRALRYASERKRLEWMKDEFVASVSHELRTPLTSISGSLSLLMGNAAGVLPEQALRLLKIAHTNSQRLVRLVNDILDIEKMEAGRIVFNLGRVDIRPVIEDAIEASQGFADGNAVRIRFEDSKANVDVRGDTDRLTQVLINLLSNAIKFSPAGGEIVVSLTRENGAVKIAVLDHGCGIPETFKPRMFERFAQADGTNVRQNGGTGLGLSIVKQIVDRLGGDVSFEDVRGGGTVFTVTLPSWDLVEIMADDDGAAPGAIRILLCEDDLEAASLLREQLRPSGFATDFAHTARDAISRAVERPYGAVLVDLMLPDRNGLSIILRLRQMPQYSTTPIIVLSADPSPARDDARSSELNVADWLKKPVDLARLVRGLPKAGVSNVH